MRDVYEVLRQKELEVSRLQKEVEALRVAACHSPKLERARLELREALQYQSRSRINGSLQRSMVLIVEPAAEDIEAAI